MPRQRGQLPVATLERHSAVKLFVERARAARPDWLSSWKRVYSPWGVAVNVCQQGKTQIGRDDEKALALFQESLQIRGRIGDRRGVAECLEGLAEVSFERQALGRCLTLLTAAEALREAIAAPLPPAGRRHLQQRMEALRCALKPGEFESARRRRAMSLGEAVALGLETSSSAQQPGAR